jgi:hypothetical protein
MEKLRGTQRTHQDKLLDIRRLSGLNQVLSSLVVHLVGAGGIEAGTRSGGAQQRSTVSEGVGERLSIEDISSNEFSLMGENFSGAIEVTNESSHGNLPLNEFLDDVTSRGSSGSSDKCFHGSYSGYGSG